MIPWRPIAELPDALKDGREVLLHDRGCSYVGQYSAIGEWLIALDSAIAPTHFAEINAAMSDEVNAALVGYLLRRDAEMRARLEHGMAEAINRMARNMVPRLARRTMTRRGFRRWRARIWRNA